jgi:hypothetical protein
MNDLKHLLDELAGEAREYHVIDDAWRLRHRGRRRLATAGAVAATMVAVLVILLGVMVARPHHPTALALPTDCVGRLLPAPAGFAGTRELKGADPTGRYAVGRARQAGGSSPIMWVDGVPTALDVPNNADLVAVNSAGVAVGIGEDPRSRDQVGASMVMPRWRCRRYPGSCQGPGRPRSTPRSPAFPTMVGSLPVPY